jgi:phosphatidylserine/phosphatidylglycerophosphate/cardiolipin synthase-like enzyme
MSKKKKKSGGKMSGASLGGMILVVLLVIVAYIFGIDLEEFGLDLSGEGSVATETTAGGGQGDWYDIYFTSGNCPPAEERRGGIDEIIAADIRQAQRQVDIAIYEFESDAMVEAVIDARSRGVLVRVVTDSDNIDRHSIPQLRQAGIHVVEDNRSAFMHNKFVIIDDSVVWTGSMNFTPNDVYCNNNNMVRFQSTRLAANYTAEMDEKYIDGLFGPTSPQNTPHEQLDINNIRVENYFGPETRIAPIMIERINAAQQEIIFMAFSFTHTEMGEAMLARGRAGVTIQGVFERTGSETQFSNFPPLRNANLPNINVRQDGNPRAMHHKVIVIDRELTIFGSFNFSANANDRNDENVVMVHDPVFASYFLEEFTRVWGEARQ